MPEFKSLNVAVIGGGLGGLSAAVALRRAGHKVSVYERRDFAAEVGASISCAANGTQWLRAWGVNIPNGEPTILLKLIMREFRTGKVLNTYDLSEYEKTWGNVYNMFHRQDMHRILLEAATEEEGEGTPAKVVVDHICNFLDYETGEVGFENGVKIKADLIIGADGIRSAVRGQIGVVPDMKSSPQTCYRCNVRVEDIDKYGLAKWAAEPAIQYWGGYEADNLSKYYKIVMSPCHGDRIISFYCFMPTEMTNHFEEGFSFAEVPVSDILAGQYSEVHPEAKQLIEHSVDRMPWRLYVHQPYDYWYKGKACILGDAAHPMMPHQSQGACMAIEDAAALGLIFSKDHPEYTQNVEAGLKLYQDVRKPRATRVQYHSFMATENINERIGFSELSAPDAKLAAKAGKLTINEMNKYDMKADVAEKAAAESAQVPAVL